MKIDRLLITGAGGGLGSVLRKTLSGKFPIVRAAARREIEPLSPGEEVVVCDLADPRAVDSMLRGVDAVVHLGAQAVEADWDVIRESNIVGCFNLWEAARKAGTKRIIFASSNHVVGFHRRTTRLNAGSEVRPDSLYGVSKVFGEALGRYYADKYGISCLAIRIGSCCPEPEDRRMLSTWLSYVDFTEMVLAGLGGRFHFDIVYGVSGNTRSWWDNEERVLPGYAPQKNAEDWAQDVQDKGLEDPVAEQFQGGSFAAEDFSGNLSEIE